jgi:hypothetical protein
MTGRETNAQFARNRAAERARNSSQGLRQTARELRDHAPEVVDENDRTAMLRLASEFERRANHLEQRVKIPLGE